MDGWVKIHRKILDNAFCHGSAERLGFWSALILMANHTANDFYIGTKKIHCEPGEFCTGRDALSAKMGLHRSKTERYLICLENDKQIEQQKTNKYRLIKICNWDKYQIHEQQMSNKRATDEQQMSTNKNDKNDKNDKNELLNTVAAKPPRELTDVQKLVHKFFSLKGWEYDESTKAVFARFLRPAKDILGLCSLEEAFVCLEDVKRWADAKSLDWSMETVLKKWFEISQLAGQIESNKKAFIGKDRAYERSGEWFVILPNGEHKHWIGSKKEIRYE